MTIALLTMVMVATSCASRKKTVAPPQSQTFEWMTANLDIQAEGNGMAFDNLAGQIRMHKDSLFWLTVTATMGVEVLRAKVSNDSVWFINRMEKTYLAEPLDSVSAQLGIPLSLPWVQTMLLNNNEDIPPVENQMVQLRTFVMGEWAAKIKYNNIKLNEKTSFPLKITDKMERIHLKKQ
jgi:hypothetical protein